MLDTDKLRNVRQTLIRFCKRDEEWYLKKDVAMQAVMWTLF